MSNINEIVYRNFLILSAGALVMTGHGQLKMKHDTEIFQKRPNIRSLCGKSDLSIPKQWEHFKCKLHELACSSLMVSYFSFSTSNDRPQSPIHSPMQERERDNQEKNYLQSVNNIFCSICLTPFAHYLCLIFSPVLLSPLTGQG